MLMWNALLDGFYPHKTLMVPDRTEHACDFKGYGMRQKGLDIEDNYMRPCLKSNCQNEAACQARECMPFNPSPWLVDLCVQGLWSTQ